jgi:hypothetical protein
MSRHRLPTTAHQRAAGEERLSLRIMNAALEAEKRIEGSVSRFSLLLLKYAHRQAPSQRRRRKIGRFPDIPKAPLGGSFVL